MIYNTELQTNNSELHSILDAVNALPDVGGGNELDVFRYMNNINGLFENASFPEGTKLTMNLESLRYASMASLFYNATGIEEIKMIANPEVTFIINSMFRSKSIKVIDLEDFNFLFSAASSCFYYAENLETIKGELDFTEATTVVYMFDKCEKLSYVRLKPSSLSLSISFKDSSLLSAESIQSIINGLADLTGQTTQTITFHATVKVKLTEEQITQITGKNWTLAQGGLL